MTLVVARILGERIAIGSDTMLTEHGQPLPIQRGVIKSCMLPGDICVSFSNSPDLAARDFKRYIERFPRGAGLTEAVSFFETSSSETENDYIIAFSRPAKLLTIANGRLVKTSARTHWIGDKSAYERFREYESKQRRGMESGRAVNAVLFADELSQSPASDLYSTMRHVVADQRAASTGGFVCIVSSRDHGFRHSVYSDMLFNWPESESRDFVFQLSDQIDFGASGENSDYSIAQISTGFMALNIVAFYLLKPRKLFLYYGVKNGLANQCTVISDVEPIRIPESLREFSNIDLRWLLMITGSSRQSTSTTYRSPILVEEAKGTGFAFVCHANTFPKAQTE